MRTKPKSLRSRFLEPISECLIRDLIVPSFYWDAPWPTARHGRIDLVAVDRAGSGDVHLVEIKQRPEEAGAAIEKLMKVPAQFRWVASFFPHNQPELALFPDRGPGRVGLIELVRMNDDEYGANILVRAERFPEYVADVSKRFLHRVKPTIQFG